MKPRERFALSAVVIVALMAGADAVAVGTRARASSSSVLSAVASARHAQRVAGGGNGSGALQPTPHPVLSAASVEPVAPAASKPKFAPIPIVADAELVPDAFDEHAQPIPRSASATRAPPSRLAVRPQQREMARREAAAAATRARAAELERQYHASASSITAIAADQQRAAAAAAAAAARAAHEKAAFEAEAAERSRRATAHRLAWVSHAHAAAALDKAEHDRVNQRGDNEFASEPPLWDFDMSVKDRIRAATEAPVLEMNYCCCRCGGDNTTHDDSDAIFEFAEATEYECEDDWCAERFALCRSQFVWNGRTGTIGLRGVEEPPPRAVERHCEDLWRRSLEMISVLAVSS